MSKKRFKRKKRAEVKTLKKRRYKLLITSFLLVVLLTMMSFLIEIKLPTPLTMEVLGNRTLVITLYKISKLDTRFNGSVNNEISVVIGNENVTFLIPNVSKDVEFIKESKSLVINEGSQALKTYLKIGNAVFPGPEVNPSSYEDMDYILTYFPYEIHFVFSSMLCNASIKVVSKNFLRIDKVFIKSNDNKTYADVEECYNSTCFLKLNMCLLKPDVEAVLTAFNLVKIKATSKEAYLDLKENLWLPLTLGVAVITLTAFKVGYVKRSWK